MKALIPLFWTSGNASSGFQNQSRQPYSCLIQPLGGKHASRAIHTCEQALGLETRFYHATTVAYALPNETCQLGVILCFQSMFEVANWHKIHQNCLEWKTKVYDNSNSIVFQNMEATFVTRNNFSEWFMDSLPKQRLLFHYMRPAWHFYRTIDIICNLFCS